MSPMVRPIEASDLDRLLAINEANVPEVGPVDAARLDFLVAESAIALAVDVGADDAAAGSGPAGPVGFCLVLAAGSSYDSVNYRWFMDRDPSVLYLDRVAVDAAFRGRGLGRMLYAEVDRLMRADHPAAPALTLEVNVDPPNEASLAFHRRLGFVEVGRQLAKGIEVSLMSRPT